MILLRGRNIWPQDVEWAVEQISPLKSGTTAAIGVEMAGEERLVLLVQSGVAEGERAALTQKIATVLGETLGAGGGSIWYRWTAPANGRAHFATCGGDFDTTLAAYTGTEVNDLGLAAANDNAVNTP